MTDSKTDQQNETVLDFGEKRVPRQNYSRVLTLNKEMLRNCGCDVSDDSEIKVKVELVKRPDEDFIKITPLCPVDGQNMRIEEDSQEKAN